MAQLILDRGNSFKKGIFRNFLRSFHFELGPFFLLASLIGFVVLITVITLMFSTRQVTKGYVLDRLETEHQQLIKESESNEMQISKVRSLEYIQQSSKVKKMRKVPEIVFVNVGDTAIASR